MATRPTRSRPSSNVDSSIYGAPKGLSALGSPSGDMLPPKPQGNPAVDSPDPLNPVVIEIEIEDPENLSEEDAELIEALNDAEALKNVKFEDNLAEHLDEDTLAQIAEELLTDYEKDRVDR